MSDKLPRAEDYLDHMIEAAGRIQIYTGAKTEADFDADTLLQDGVLRNIAVLGEAAKNLLAEVPDLATRYPSIPFAKIYGMRNQVEHGYYTIDFGIVWNVVQREIPRLLSELQALRAVWEQAKSA